jgi:hypothetical protein
MKKLITLLIVLICCVGTVGAENITVYFEPGTNWSQGSAKFVMHLQKYGSDDSQRWIDFTEVEGRSGIYSATYEYKSTDDRCWIFRKGPSMESGWTKDTNYWNQSAQLTVPSTDCYITKDDSSWDNWSYTPRLLPWNYYFMSGSDGNYTIVDKMAESEGVYSYSFSGKTYANKQVGWASGQAFAAASNSLTDWTKVVHSTSENDKDHWICFQSYSYSSLTETAGSVWYVPASDNEYYNDGLITIEYTPATNSATINSAKSTSISSALYATWSNGEKYTVSGATAYTVSANNTSSVTLTQQDSETIFPAGTGIILNGTDGATVTINAVAGASEASTIGTNYLKDTGNTSQEITATANTYVFANDDSNGVGFYKASGTGTLAAHKAYLDLSEESGAREGFLGFNFDEETTGITEVRSTQSDGAIYNMQGVRLSKFQKGLNLVNGKKILVK